MVRYSSTAACTLGNKALLLPLPVEAYNPSRVFKGVRLPGHMGCDTVTTKNLEVVRVDEDMNLIMLKGAVPGGKNGVVRIRMA